MMDARHILSLFFTRAAGDCRIGIGHIGLYATLVQMTIEQEAEGPLVTYGAQVMVLAKISSTATYHRLIRELNAYGYIVYKPSFYKGRGSRIFIT